MRSPAASCSCLNAASSNTVTSVSGSICLASAALNFSRRLARSEPPPASGTFSAVSPSNLMNLLSLSWCGLIGMPASVAA